MCKVRVIALLMCFFLCCHCAGKLPRPKRVRFLPETLKTIYVARVINLSEDKEIHRILEEELIDYFQKSREMSYRGNLRGADVFLEAEINEYFTSPVIRTSHPLRRRFWAEVSVSLKNVASKKAYVDSMKFSLSILYDLLPNDGGFSLKEARKTLCKKIAENVESIIVSGHAAVGTLYGYENFEDTRRLSEKIADRYQYETDNYENHSRAAKKAASLSNREAGIREIDKDGLK